MYDQEIMKQILRNQNTIMQVLVREDDRLSDDNIEGSELRERIEETKNQLLTLGL